MKLTRRTRRRNPLLRMWKMSLLKRKTKMRTRRRRRMRPSWPLQLPAPLLEQQVWPGPPLSFYPLSNALASRGPTGLLSEEPPLSSETLLVPKTPGDLIVKLIMFLSQLLHLLDLVLHQPLNLVPVESEGVHFVETDWSIILSGY